MWSHNFMPITVISCGCKVVQENLLSNLSSPSMPRLFYRTNSLCVDAHQHCSPPPYLFCEQFITIVTCRKNMWFGSVLMVTTAAGILAGLVLCSAAATDGPHQQWWSRRASVDTMSSVTSLLYSIFKTESVHNHILGTHFVSCLQ